MARAFRWADALADRLEVGPVAAGLIAGHLETTPAAVLAGARSIPGAWTDTATGFVHLPDNARRRALGTLLSALTYAVGSTPVDDPGRLATRDVSAYTAAVGRLRRRWVRGNFAVPRDLGRALKVAA
jgi:hypothetical protein